MGRAQRNNHEIATYTGGFFDILDPESHEYKIEDIAHSLALTNRYGGHTSAPYSVAQHCVLASYMDVGIKPIYLLLHDAAEAYLVGDVASPQKRLLYVLTGYDENVSINQYKYIEESILYWIGRSFGLSALAEKTKSAEVKKADLLLLVTEVRDLMHPNWDIFKKMWAKEIEPLASAIRPWRWDYAERRFLERFHQLMDRGGIQCR